jgi:glycosyltransferase involved in cell wall biosynthesis
MSTPQVEPRSAVVQDWFFTPGGSERCAVEFARLLPTATVHTSFFDPAYAAVIDPSRVRTWPLQRLLGPTQRYRMLLPLYPIWFSSLDLRRCDLVLTDSSAFAYAVRTGDRTLHVSYVHTPMRYAWDLDGYLAGSSLGSAARAAATVVRPWLKRWDLAMSRRPDVLVANSTGTRERIRRIWNRDAAVIHPPVDASEIGLSSRDDGFLLVAARMLAYRRIDLAIHAANRLGRELVVVGHGPEAARLRAMAGPTVRFTGVIDRQALIDLFERCHAYLVSGEEDFGIAPVEAMAAGKPVIAFRAGGALDTVVDGKTGIFFDGATADALASAIETLDAYSFDPIQIRKHALTFDVSEFRRKWRDRLLAEGASADLLAPPR